MIYSDNIESIRDPTEGPKPRKIKEGFIKYLHFPHEISLNRFRKYGIYCSNLNYIQEKNLPHSPSSIKRMKFIRSSTLVFPKVFEPHQFAINANSVFNQHINKELKKLSRMISHAKDLHSFTFCLFDYDIKKEQGFYGISEKLKNLKKISSMNIQFSQCNINDDEMKELLKVMCIQKKSSKLDISYHGDSMLKKGFISLNKTIASCQNLSDLRVYLGFSTQNLPSMITNEFFNELSRLTELKALKLTFPKVVNTDKGFFESITQCFKELKKLQRLDLTFQAGYNIENKNLKIMARRLSEFNELSHLSLNLGRIVKINTAIEDISNSVQILKNLKSFYIHLDGYKKIDEKVFHSSISKISAQTSLTTLTLNFGEINIPDNFIMLGNLYQLKNLDLSFYCRGSLTNGMLSSISQALSCLKGLESFRLYISGSKESDTSVYCLADALTSSTKLKSLILTFQAATFLTDSYCNYLKEPFSKLQELECLELYFPSPQLTDQGIVEISSALASLRKLLSLKLNFYNCQNEDKSFEAIGNAILNMNKIKLLSLIFGHSLVTSQGIL